MTNVSTVKVSVIIPVYNTSAYLRECLDSIVNQTFRGIEVICIDDGSTDDSASILREYADKDERFSVITQSNTGISGARNNGMDVARGEFIMFVDSDDYMDCQILELFISEIGDSDVIVSGVELEGEINLKRMISDVKYFRIPNGSFDLNDDMIMGMYINTGGKMFRKSIIDRYNIRFPVGLNYEDHSFQWQYMSASKRITFLRKKLYHYRYRKESVMDITRGKSRMALKHIGIFDNIMKTSGERITDSSTVNSLFILLFNNAFNNINDGDRGELIDMSRAMVHKYDLDGKGVIEILRSDANADDMIDAIIRYNDIFSTIRDIDRLRELLADEGIGVLMKKLLWGLFCKLTG